LGFAFAIAAAVLAGGCATQGPRGFYAKSLSPAQSAEMAEDTARQMAALYPPASTYLSMKQPAQDPFGTALVGKLRGKGYALAEALASKNPSKAAVMATVGVDFGYVVDGLGADNSYRVTATVGQETLSRAYLASNDRLSATGYWVRRRM
jgi:hypothetical protein